MIQRKKEISNVRLASKILCPVLYAKTDGDYKVKPCGSRYRRPVVCLKSMADNCTYYNAYKYQHQVRKEGNKPQNLQELEDMLTKRTPMCINTNECSLVRIKVEAGKSQVDTDIVTLIYARRLKNQI